MAVEEINAQRLRRRAREHVAHEDHVPERLRHLLAVQTDRRGVHPVADEFHSVRRLALRGLALMVRVHEVAAAAVDVDRQAEVLLGHRRTLEVPARPSAAERARPRRAVRHAAPEREIERRPAPRLVERRIVLRRVDRAHPRRREMAHLAEPREGRDVEVQTAAFGHVGLAASLEACREAKHRRDLARRVWHLVGLAPAERAHVGEELPLLAPSELAPVDVIPRRALQDRLVDVGDVLRVAHALAAGLEETHEHVEDEERAGVTEVRRVVRRDAADVHRDERGARTERHCPAATRVVEGEHRR